MSKGILDADMVTVARMIRTGLIWWRDELSGLLPQRLRGMRRRRGPVVLFRPGAVLQLHRGNGAGEDLPAGGRPRQLDIAIPAALSLQRDVTVPVMSRSDLRSYVAIAADRLLPLGSDQLLVDALPGDRTVDGQMTVRIGSVERKVVDEALMEARIAGVTPGRIGIVEHHDPQHMRYDFAPILRAEGTLPGLSVRRQAWWALVGFALLANVALLIWRDQQDVARLQRLVDEQAPAVLVYRAMVGRTQRTMHLAEATISRRRSHDVVGDLAATTAALPDEAWLQRYAWDGRTLRLSGYMRPAIDVIAALRRDPRFINIRSTGGDVSADIPAGRPFDVTAETRGARR